MKKGAWVIVTNKGFGNYVGKTSEYGLHYIQLHSEDRPGVFSNSEFRAMKFKEYLSLVWDKLDWAIFALCLILAVVCNWEMMSDDHVPSFWKTFTYIACNAPLVLKVFGTWANWKRILV